MKKTLHGNIELLCCSQEKEKRDGEEPTYIHKQSNMMLACLLGGYALKVLLLASMIVCTRSA
jgi:hypothetical protein